MPVGEFERTILRLRRALLGLGLAACAPALAAPPEVIIDPGGAPPKVLQAITDAVGAITRLTEDQDVREVSRLRRRAWEAAQAALRTQGYFDATVTLDVSPGAANGGEFWDITIDTGERARVRQLGLRFDGALAGEAYAGRRRSLRDSWLLKPGMPFINDDWSRAKTELLDAVSRQEFYYARYAQTRAAVEPEAAKADLDVALDSGPPVRLGELQIIGLKRVPESLIRRYVRYEPGEPYDQTRLEDWQQALQSTTFFRGAFVTLADGTAPAADTPGDADAAGTEAKTGTEPETAAGTGAGAGAAATRVRPAGDDPVTLPVRVQVTEGPARYASGSLGVDSDHGVRVEGLYRQNVVYGLPVWIETGAGVDTKRQRAFFDVHLPPDMDGREDSFGLLYDHSDVEGLETSRTGLGWKRSQTRKAAGDSRVEYEVRWGALVAYDKTRISGDSRYEVPSWAATWQWLRRDVDSKYNPREGNLVEFGLGLGTTLDDGKAFYRSSLRAQRWWPVGERDVLTVRGEIGKVWSRTDRLPQDFSWRTGGSRSIRGYRYQSIGLERGDAIMGAPVLGVASVEYTHYFTDILGASLFVDAGDAAESFGQFDWHLGYGAGLAVRTPAGPFFVDLAWAQKDRRLRLQFSLGIAF
ncbi:autotransporter assembly complex protein TamA [Castellaniella defragrans]|uniref:autotransporter assembly complex protein TamA n=1 Tax=Castellaniella defragrans TaxID=75697 RepID=UPI0023F11D61|nr:BamA/TamA family outer membrane protein [Castellaniella defragrans]